MQRNARLALVVGTLALVAMATAPALASPDGKAFDPKKVVGSHKCTACHAKEFGRRQT